MHIQKNTVVDSNTVVNSDNLTEIRFQQWWENNLCVELQKLYLPFGSEQDCNSVADVPVQSPGSGKIYTKATQRRCLLCLHWSSAQRELYYHGVKYRIGKEHVLIGKSYMETAPSCSFH